MIEETDLFFVIKWSQQNQERKSLKPNSDLIIDLSRTVSCEITIRLSRFVCQSVSAFGEDAHDETKMI